MDLDQIEAEMREIGDSCVAAPPAFDLTTFLKMGCDVDYMSQLTSLPTTSRDFLMQRSPTQVGVDGRKRRRGEVANPANTLDGLVARRADDGREPFEKRYLSEQEAIEGPDDEEEMKRMEKDPDVSTRTCSTCGYQGKWVSEMVRHKRVHTSERPFKCRFCSRTSKWKADLIRHMAKTHGIRVVSKFSRSKTFDTTSTNLGNDRSDDDKPRVFACEPDKEPDRQRQDSPSDSDCDNHIHRPEPLSLPKRPLSYRCVQCLFEQDGLSIMLHHLRNVHNVSPYECRCGVSFETIDAALTHSNVQQSCSPNDLIVNITPIYNNVQCKSYSSRSSGSTHSLSPVSGSRRGDSSPDSGLQLDDDFEMETMLSCDVCPFRSRSEGSMVAHKVQHNAQKAGLPVRAPITPMLISPQFGQLPDITQPLLPSPTFDLNALLTLQSRFAPMYLASMLQSTLLASPSAFTPVATPLASCNKCDARFRDTPTLAAHQKFHGSSLPLSCPLCDYRVGKMSNLLKHVQSHHQGFTYPQAECQPEEDEEAEEKSEKQQQVETEAKEEPEVLDVEE